MELYQLKYVLAVAKHQNFTRAADELCVTPSSLSQQIKKLEDELGVVLFGRTTRSVHLTLAGIEFVEIAKKVMDDISGINTAMQKYVHGESGVLSIGGTPALKVYGITHLIAAFQKTYPKIKLNIHEAECCDLYLLILNGKIDVAFFTAFNKLASESDPLEAYPLVNDELVIVTNMSHPFAAKKEVDLREASEEKFIALATNSGLYLDTIDACKLAGFEPKFVYETQYVDTCLGLVAEGLGIAMLSSRSVTNTLWKNISVIRLKTGVTRTLYLVTPKRKKISPVISNFKSFVINGY